MCGIFCVCSTSDVNTTDKLSKIYQEFSFNLCRRGPNQSKIEVCHNEDQIFLFAASVLWLQGSKLVKQPINGDFLLVYNGDIFDIETKKYREMYGDTKLFLDYFKSDKLPQNLFNLNGPFAFICLDKEQSLLHFGRDKFGRRSLLIGKSDKNEIILTSVAKRNTSFIFKEVPALGIFTINCKTKEIALQPWMSGYSNFKMKLQDFSEFLNQTIAVGETVANVPFQNFIEPSLEDLQYLDTLEEVSFGNLSDTNALSHEVNYSVQKLQNLLQCAVEKRISNQPRFCQDCIKDQITCNHAIIGVLFSGGVDCAILAYLAHKFIDKDRPIDLLNVAFSNNNFDTPDRLTGRQTLRELQELCPERDWNFVEINVTFEELDKERRSRIADLIYPLNTILDDSLGCALWFASRGISKDYISTCRTLLIGSGADELFGGYSSHQTAFMNESWVGLHRSLKESWENLPYRNLGRDDRVVSDHGRQLRTPYLDEDVVEFVMKLNCWEKTLPLVREEIRTKILLRAVAYHLGLKNAAILRKRALQFGSRVANSKENAYEVSPRL